MILDELWRAERHDRKERTRLKQKYGPLISAAKQKHDLQTVESLLSEMRYPLDLAE